MRDGRVAAVRRVEQVAVVAELEAPLAAARGLQDVGQELDVAFAVDGGGADGAGEEAGGGGGAVCGQDAGFGEGLVGFGQSGCCG